MKVLIILQRREEPSSFQLNSNNYNGFAIINRVILYPVFQPHPSQPTDNLLFLIHTPQPSLM